jgi:hypothetical protein
MLSVFYATGLVWAYIAVEWVLMIMHALAFRRHPISGDLNLGQRTAAREQTAQITGRNDLSYRAAILLHGWAEGLAPEQIISLCAEQSRRSIRQIAAGGFFALMVLVPCMFMGTDYLVVWVAFAALALTLYIKLSLLQWTDRYLEKHLLVRLPAHLPGTGISADELGGLLGSAIESSFSKYIPQPQQMAESIRSAVADIGRNSAEQTGKMEKALAENMQQMFDQWNNSARETLSALEKSQQVLTQGWTSTAEKAAQQLSGAQQSLSSQWKDAAQSMDQQLDRLQETLSKLTEELNTGIRSETQQLIEATRNETQKMSDAGGTWKQQLEDVLNEHVDKMQGATEALASELKKILSLEHEIKEVLHIQEMVDGTIKSVTATEEFQGLLKTLNTHLAESDKLLREAAKPRTIRLVEMDADARKKDQAQT